MGVIIFTQDDARYRKGDYLTMYGDITINPTAPETTYILHNKKFSEDELIYWASIVPHRMVIVVDKPPKLTSKSEHCVILDQIQLQLASLQTPVVSYDDADFEVVE